MATFTSEGPIFSFSGGREMVDVDRIHELLNPIKDITHPSVIRLSNKSFSKSAAEIIASVICSFKNVKLVDISDVIAGRHELEALEVLSKLCNSLVSNNLTELNLSDNALGAKGVEACRALLSGKYLERLFLCNNGLSAEASELISQLLLEGGNYPPLKLLHFFNNMSGDGGAIAISLILKAIPTINNFRFSATRSRAAGCLAISEALSSLNSLTHLDISDNNFGHAATMALASALRKQTSLNTLNLRDCGFGEDDSTDIMRALATGGKDMLTFLDLSGNSITSDTLDTFCNVTLPALTSLRDLYLDDNEIGTEGAEKLSEAIKNNKPKQLRLLSVETCELTAAGACSLARVVSKLPSFERLQCNGNQISELAVIKMTGMLTAASKLLGDMEDNDGDAEDDLDELEEEEEEEEEEEDFDNETAASQDKEMESLVAELEKQTL